MCRDEHMRCSREGRRSSTACGTLDFLHHEYLIYTYESTTDKVSTMIDNDPNHTSNDAVKPDESVSEGPPKKKCRASSEDDFTEPRRVRYDELLEARANLFDILDDCKSQLGGTQAEAFKKLYMAARVWEALEDLLLPDH